MSIRPGSSVRVPRSITRALAGAASPALPTLTIRSPSTTTCALSSTRPANTSTICAARITTGSACAATGNDSAAQRAARETERRVMGSSDWQGLAASPMAIPLHAKLSTTKAQPVEKLAASPLPDSVIERSLHVSEGDFQTPFQKLRPMNWNEEMQPEGRGSSARSSIGKPAGGPFRGPSSQGNASQPQMQCVAR